MAYHSMALKEVFKSLGSDEKGLSACEASRRLLQYGPNQLKEEKKTSKWIVFLSHFNSFNTPVGVIFSMFPWP